VADAEEALFREKILEGVDKIFNTDIDGGISIFSEIRERFPDNPAPLIYEAMALMSYPPREGEKGIHPEAIEALLVEGITIIEGKKDWGEDGGKVLLLDATGHSLLTQLYLGEKRYAKAMASAIIARRSIERAYTISPHDPDILYGMGLFMYGVATAPSLIKPVLSAATGVSPDKERGLSLIERAAEEGVYTKTPARFFLLLVTVNIEGDFERAARYGGGLIARYPNNPEIYFPYAYALSELGRYDEALLVCASFREKMEKNYPFFDEAIEGRYHHLLGKIYMDKGDLRKAEGEFEKARVVFDKNYAWVGALALARMGMIADLEGDRALAEKQYREVLDMDLPGVGAELAEKYLAAPYRGK